MKKQLILALMILCSLATSVSSKEHKWLQKMKQIKILSDARIDVLKLFGDPFNNRLDSYVWSYHFENETMETEEGSINISFSFNSCKSVGVTGGLVHTGWKVPDWTVVEVSFSPSYDGIKPKDLGIINFNGFRPVPEDDFPEMVVYKNDKTGIDYTVYEEKITGITFRGTKKQVKNLACKKEDIKQNSTNKKNKTDGLQDANRNF